MVSDPPDPTKLDGWTLFFDRTQAAGPLIAAFLVLLGVGLTIWQKNRTDQRNLWWSRVQWAADLTASGSQRERAVGMAALLALAADRNRNQADLELLGTLVDTHLGFYAEEHGIDGDPEFEVGRD